MSKNGVSENNKVPGWYEKRKELESILNNLFESGEAQSINYRPVTSDKLAVSVRIDASLYRALSIIAMDPTNPWHTISDVVRNFVFIVMTVAKDYWGESKMSDVQQIIAALSSLNKRGQSEQLGLDIQHSIRQVDEVVLSLLDSGEVEHARSILLGCMKDISMLPKGYWRRACVECLLSGDGYNRLVSSLTVRKRVAIKREIKILAGKEKGESIEEKEVAEKRAQSTDNRAKGDASKERLSGGRKRGPSVADRPGPAR